MRTQKSLALLATVSLLGLSVACSDRYSEGLAEGKKQGEQGYAQAYDEGYDDGHADGDAAGFERAKAYFASADYNAGFTAGQAAAGSTSYNTGFAAGQADLTVKVAASYAKGYDVGYDDGNADGYDAGYDDGMLDGYDMGYDDGMLDGYDMGYDDGMLDGYDIGYDDGYDDGFSDGSGFSVGKTAALKGYSNLLSLAHNDLFDYKKIASPKSSASKVVANGKLLFEETSLTNKDTLKRAAVIEQYLVVEMSKQVAKFGLSAERSIKIAKAANHFRKFASTRALTAEDTNAYVTEIVGVDLKTIESAKASGNMKSVLEAAAAKNGTSPEKMAEILAKNFI